MRAVRERLHEEINVLKLEGIYFCFDKHETVRRKGKFRYGEGDGAVVIELSNYGQPSLLAYKVLQAIFYSMTREGHPYPAHISFDYRELGRLIGRTTWGGKDQKEVQDAIYQLTDTHVSLTLKRADGKRDRLRMTVAIDTMSVVEEDESISSVTRCPTTYRVSPGLPFGRRLSDDTAITR